MSEHITKIVPKHCLRQDEPMKHHTSFRIGGPADFMVFPDSEDQVRLLVEMCRKYDFSLLVMGRGSNMLVPDQGIRGVVVVVGENLNSVAIHHDQVWVQSGVSLNSLSRTLLQMGLSGCEFAGGIPGTVGGALAMNAGAYGGEMRDVLVSCKVMDRSGRITHLSCDEMELGYRSSRVQKTREIILSATLKLRRGDYQQIKFLMEDYWQRRITKQPYYLPSGGSVFKRPEGYFAGKLIEDCGLKGKAIGGAMVSELHAGFIVNTGHATAHDVLRLMALIQKRVKERFKVDLEPELRLIESS